MYDTHDTIAAVASAAGPAARGIVRLSGPEAVAIVERCFIPHDVQPRLSELRAASAVEGVFHLQGARRLDLAATLYLWPNQRSYTRQPMAELHTLGSPALLAALVRTLCAAGARAALPGEFTLRAFLAGRLDLTQAEAVLGVIDAQGDRELQTALEQMAGGMARPLEQLRHRLLDLLAHLEAGLDFVEEDIEFITADELARELATAAAALTQIAEQLAARERVDDVPRVALVGWPNVGKSSLFNALAQAGALVSNQPGTTRDYLTARVSLGELECELVDTAGVDSEKERQSIAARAQRFTSQQAERCDLQLLCLDSTRTLNAWEREQLAEANPAKHLIVLTKCDEAGEQVPTRDSQVPTCNAISTSARTGLGLDRLRAALRQALLEASESESSASLTGERCRESLRAAAAGLVRAAELNRLSAGEELIAAELHAVLDEIGKVTGAVYTDDILDRIFSRFCIGK